MVIISITIIHCLACTYKNYIDIVYNIFMFKNYKLLINKKSRTYNVYNNKDK